MSTKIYNSKKGRIMAFCKFSTEYSKVSDITLDAKFVSDYMPFVPDVCTKVYLYGLFKCLSKDDCTNTLDCFASELNMSDEDVKSAFLFLQEQGLVTVLNLSPIEVRFLPVRSKKINGKMFDKEKYAEFNKQIQEILDGRMITPNEFREYYILMESMHIEEDALAMIAKYCTNLKGNNVSYSYILAVAKNWAYDGVHTAQDVENKISEMEVLTSSVKDVLVALKSKKQPTYEDKDMFNKWTKQFGYDLQTIVALAKKIKRGGIVKLDEQIEKYYELKLFDLGEIENYENSKKDLSDIAKSLCKAIGVYYDNLDPVINTYILKWKQMGYSADALLMVANICFKKFIRNFEGMDAIIGKYFAKGLVSVDSINEYIASTLSVDKRIKEILEKLQLSRQVTTWDRDFYHTWTYSWQFGDDMIDYACSLAVGKSQPMTYVNKILSNWKEQNITTLKDAQKVPAVTSKVENVEHKSEFMTHSFSSEELGALFDNLDEVKLI